MFLQERVIARNWAVAFLRRKESLKTDSMDPRSTAFKISADFPVGEEPRGTDLAMYPSSPATALPNEAGNHVLAKQNAGKEPSPNSTEAPCHETTTDDCFTALWTKSISLMDPSCVAGDAPSQSSIFAKPPSRSRSFVPSGNASLAQRFSNVPVRRDNIVVWNNFLDHLFDMEPPIFSFSKAV